MTRCTTCILTTASVFLLLGSAVEAAQPEKIEPLKLDSKAPDFNLPGVDGKRTKLSDFDKYDILVIVFTANHCPTAQAYEERIKKLVTDYKPRGVAVVAISPNDPEAVRLDELGYTDVGDSLQDMALRARDKKFNFPYLYDGDTQKVSRAYGPLTTPHVFIFDKDRTLRFVGRIDDNERRGKAKEHDTRNAIEAMLAGREVPVKQTKTFGCSIKWASKRDGVAKALERYAAEPVSVELIDAAGIKELVKNDSKKLRLINVWATWCGPCVYEFPQLVEIHRMYRRRDFELITVSADSPQTKDNVLSFLTVHQASTKNYLFNSDDRYALMEAVDDQWRGGVPYTVLVKPGGEIMARRLGVIEPLEFKRMIVEYVGRTYE